MESNVVNEQVVAKYYPENTQRPDDAAVVIEILPPVFSPSPEKTSSDSTPEHSPVWRKLPRGIVYNDECCDSFIYVCSIMTIILIFAVIITSFILIIIGSICLGTGDMHLCLNAFGSAVAMVATGVGLNLIWPCLLALVLLCCFCCQNNKD